MSDKGDLLQVGLLDEDEHGFNYAKIISSVLRRWPWILLSVIMCCCGAYAYLRYTPPTFMSSMKLLIKGAEGQGHNSYASIDVSAMGEISNSNGFDNELEIICSKDLARRTVKSLKLYVSYTSKPHFRVRDHYKQTPILVDLEESYLDNLTEVIHLTVSRKGKGCHISGRIGGTEENPLNVINADLKVLPATIATNYGRLLFTDNPGHAMDGTFDVTICPVSWVANSYRARLSAAPSGKTTSVAVLTFVDSNPQRAVDYLNELANSYNIDANEDKSEVARKTEQFIDDRIASIRNELDTAELDLQQFKQSNSLINLRNDASAALQASANYQEKQVEMQTQISMLRSLADYINNPDNAYQVVPVSVSVASSDLTSLIQQYNELVLERQRLLRNSNETQPVIVEKTDKIDNLRPAIKQMLRSVMENLSIQKNSIDNQYAMFTGRVNRTPGQERTLNNIVRQQELKANLYLTLLQKREENAISLASTAVKARVIDAPEGAAQVAPDSKKIWMIALAIGIGLPVMLIILLEQLRIKIDGREDVESLTKLPVLGELPLKVVKKQETMPSIVVRENSNDMMEEAFRGLRTNLRFVLRSAKQEKVLLVTSVIPGEGKTFVSTNLAMSYALLGKKVIVVGLDIRKPRLARLFGLSNTKCGIVNYLIAENQSTELLDEQIYHGVMNPCLDVLPSGIIPPNPGEIIAQESLRNAIEYLRGKYDVVILDTPPVGLVSDSFDVAAHADATLVVCRCDVSPRSGLAMINDAAKEGKLPNANIVINAVDTKAMVYRYSHGYKYGHYGKYAQYGKYSSYGD